MNEPIYMLLGKCKHCESEPSKLLLQTYSELLEEVSDKSMSSITWNEQWKLHLLCLFLVLVSALDPDPDPVVITFSCIHRERIVLY